MSFTLMSLWAATAPDGTKATAEVHLQRHQEQAHEACDEVVPPGGGEPKSSAGFQVRHGEQQRRTLEFLHVA